MNSKPFISIIKNKKYYLLLCIFVCILSMTYPLNPLAKEDKKVVKVGYIEKDSVIQKYNEEPTGGYIYDYLLEIAKYTGWKYKFVPVTLEQGLEKLANGELDFFGPLQYTNERGKEYAFPQYAFGYEYGALFVDESNNKLFYNNFEKFNGMKVGRIPNNYFNTAFEKYAEENNFTVNYSDYNDTEDLLRALKEHKVDAIISGTINKLDNVKIIGKFSVAPTYIAVTKEKQSLLQELNKALKRIRLQDVYFGSKLYDRYYQYQTSKVALTKEENQFVKSHPKLKVVYDPDYSPVAYYDDETEKFKGINADIFQLISDYSGLEFEYIRTSDYQESVDYIEQGKADLIVGYTEISGTKPLLKTDSIIDIPVVKMGKVGSNFDDKDITLALPRSYMSSIQNIEKNYDGANIVIYNTINDCVRALDRYRKGKAENFSRNHG